MTSHLMMTQEGRGITKDRYRVDSWKNGDVDRQQASPFGTSRYYSRNTISVK